MLKLLLRRLGLVLLLMTVCRAVFWLANRSLFPASPGDLVISFAHGLRFDLSSLAWVNSLLIFASLLPFSWQKRRGWQAFLRWLWLVPNTLMLALELADAAWFPFNQRRTILTDFSLLSNSTRVSPNFLMEYWWLVALLLAMAALIFRAKPPAPPQIPNPKSPIPIFLLAIPVWLLAARGGWQLRPLMPIDAARLAADPRLAQLLPNATMNLLASVQQHFIEEKNWLTDEQLDAAFSLRQNLGHAPTDFRPLNVVTIAFEGAGEEYLQAGWLPFLDSLSRLSVCPANGYAAGTRSAEGNAAILASLPSLMEDMWVFSPYQHNKIGGIASVLRQKGYSTAFFHGADPGSMELDKLAAAAGFEQVFDRTAFPDQSQFDGKWGIYDRPFFQFFLEKLDRMREPFCAHFFSLSSHHPFRVEKSFEEKHQAMPPIERSFRYADDALRQFFEQASRKPWFERTLFVIAADHTGPERKGCWTSPEGLLRIPILFYQKGVTVGMERRPAPDVAQQVDILPSVLDWLGFSGDFDSFGRSVFQKRVGEERTAVAFQNGLYEILDGKYLLTFDGEKPVQLFDYQLDTACSKNILEECPAVAERLEARLKAVVQRHNRTMIRNQLATGGGR